MNDWTRDQKIAAIGIVVVIVLGVGGYVVTISQPEIRKAVWGDNSNASINTASVTAPTPLPSNIPTANPTPQQQPTPEQNAATDDNATRERYELELYDGFGCTCPDLQDDIEELQSLLNDHGFSLEVDGLFGFETEAAVKEFQVQRGLPEDGIVGSATWAALLEK